MMKSPTTFPKVRLEGRDTPYPYGVLQDPTALDEGITCTAAEINAVLRDQLAGAPLRFSDQLQLRLHADGSLRGPLNHPDVQPTDVIQISRGLISAVGGDGSGQTVLGIDISLVRETRTDSKEAA